MLNRETTGQAFSAALAASVHVATCRAWASVTFSGFRLVLESRDEMEPATLAALEEMDFDVPGYVVADIEATGPRRLAALLVREG
jgi:hypothetical protein